MFSWRSGSDKGLDDVIRMFSPPGPCSIDEMTMISWPLNYFGPAWMTDWYDFGSLVRCHHLLFLLIIQVTSSPSIIMHHSWSSLMWFLGHLSSWIVVSHHRCDFSGMKHHASFFAISHHSLFITSALHLGVCLSSPCRYNTSQSFQRDRFWTPHLPYAWVVQRSSLNRASYGFLHCVGGMHHWYAGEDVQWCGGCLLQQVGLPWPGHGLTDGIRLHTAGCGEHELRKGVI